MKIGTKVRNRRTNETGIVIGNMGRDPVVRYDGKSADGYLTLWQEVQAVEQSGQR
jgi:hypothetical protein